MTTRSARRSRQAKYHADAGVARDDQALVADQLAGQARQDRRQNCHPRPLRNVPDGGGRRAEGTIWRDIATDRWAATKNGSSLEIGMVQSIITTVGVCLNANKTKPNSAPCHVLHVACTPAALRTASSVSKKHRKSIIIRSNLGSSGECRLQRTVGEGTTLR